MVRFSFTERPLFLILGTAAAAFVCFSQNPPRSPLICPSSDRSPSCWKGTRNRDFDFGPNGSPKKFHFRFADCSLTGAIERKRLVAFCSQKRHFSRSTQQHHGAAARSTQQHLRPPICNAFFYMRTVLLETNTAPNPLLPPYQGLRSLCPLLRLPPTTIPPTSTPPATSPPLFLICGSSTCVIFISVPFLFKNFDVFPKIAIAS